MFMEIRASLHADSLSDQIRDSSVSPLSSLVLNVFNFKGPLEHTCMILHTWLYVLQICNCKKRLAQEWRTNSADICFFFLLPRMFHFESMEECPRIEDQKDQQIEKQ